MLRPPTFIQLKPESALQNGAGAPVEQWTAGGASPLSGSGPPLR
jgi:hypothetical protein